MDSMNKVIHAAVRRDLARLGGALDAVTDGDRTTRDRPRPRLAQPARPAAPPPRAGGHHPVPGHGAPRHRPGAGRGARGRAPGDGRALDEIDTAMGSYATSASAADAADAADAVRRGTWWSTSTWRTRRRSSSRWSASTSRAPSGRPRCASSASSRPGRRAGSSPGSRTARRTRPARYLGVRGPGAGPVALRAGVRPGLPPDHRAGLGLTRPDPATRDLRP